MKDQAVEERRNEEEAALRDRIGKFAEYAREIEKGNERTDLKGTCKLLVEPWMEEIAGIDGKRKDRRRENEGATYLCKDRALGPTVLIRVDPEWTSLDAGLRGDMLDDAEKVRSLLVAAITDGRHWRWYRRDDKGWDHRPMMEHWTTRPSEADLEWIEALGGHVREMREKAREIWEETRLRGAVRALEDKVTPRLLAAIVAEAGIGLVSGSKMRKAEQMWLERREQRREERTLRERRRRT